MKHKHINKFFQVLASGLLLMALSPVVAQETTEDFVPGARVGGPITVTASSGGEDTRWILPGLRALDSAVFGTPDMPLGFDADVGLPLEMRLTTEDGSAYTTSAGPTPFSNNFAAVTGSFNLTAVDATAIDGPASEDTIDFSATFTAPDGTEYSVTVQKVIPVGPVHTFMGGVATNIVQHGSTGIGTRMMPQVTSYLAFWGIGELSVNGEVVASNRLVHAMVTDYARNNDEYALGFDADVDSSRLQFHLILPNIEITPDGPAKSPVPTGFTLPNGNDQPFLHIMYEDVTIGSE
jgi:hypothetical protein